jgi:heptosyltransferase-2
MEYLHTIDLTREFTVPEFGVKPVKPADWRNGLAVRMPNWLGDAVMALPALRQLKRTLPAECALMVICPVGMRQFFHSLPWVDVILPLENVHRSWTAEEIATLRKLKPGVGILFNNSLRDVMMMRLARVPRLYGAAARCRGLLMSRSFRFNARLSGALNCQHHANRYLAIAASLGAPRWQGELPEVEIARRFAKLNARIRAFCEHRKMLILAAGAAYGAAKRWRSENFREVAADWIAKGGIVVAVGGPSEAAIGREIGHELPEKKYFNLMGQTDMYELMHLLRNAAAVLANDSGVMHLASALGCSGVAVFGSTDYTATGPAFGHWEILYSHRDCSPCFKRCCPRETQACMRDLPPSLAIAALDKLPPRF